MPVVAIERTTASKVVDDVAAADSNGTKMSSFRASLLADQAPLPRPPPATTDSSTVTLSTGSTPVLPRPSPYPRKISLVPQRPLPPYLINRDISAPSLKDGEFSCNKVTIPDFGTTAGAVASTASNTEAATNSAATLETAFTNAATGVVAPSPATKTKRDDNILSLSVQEGTPAHDALQANAAIKVRRIRKVARKLQVPQVLHAMKKTGSSVINPNLVHKGKKPPRIPIIDDSIEATENEYLNEQNTVQSPTFAADLAVQDGTQLRLSKTLEQKESKDFSRTEDINDPNDYLENRSSLSQLSNYKEALGVAFDVSSRAVSPPDDGTHVIQSSQETSVKMASIESEEEEGSKQGETAVAEIINDSSTPPISKRPNLSHRRAKTEGNLTSTASNSHVKSSTARRLLFPHSGSKPQPKEEHETIRKTSRKQRHHKPKKKKEKHPRKSYVKGKVIDRKHELYTLSLAVMLGLRTSIGTTNTILEKSQKEELLNRLNSCASNNDVENSGQLVEPATGGGSTSKVEEQNNKSKNKVESVLNMLRGDKVTGRLESVSKRIKEYKQKNTASETDVARWLDSYDFMAVEKYIFRPKGGPSTPPHQLSHTFKFKDYSPKAFAYIRRLNGINESEFLSSVCGNANYIEFVSNAKSGQFFFYSSDGKYMIKTMTSTESKFLRRILPHYFRHCVRYPNTLICKFLGMYRVKMYHLRRNVKFVIMNSVFDTDKFISSFYDLKGSTTGRDAKPGEYVKKDNDIRKQLPSAALNFDPTVKERLRHQIMEDCNFLKSMKIMDYSMLVGVHRIPQSKHGQAQQELNESLLTDHDSSHSLLHEDVAGNDKFSPSETYSSPISSRKVFRPSSKPFLDSDTNDRSVSDPKVAAPEHLDSPKNSGTSVDRFFEKCSPSRSFSYSEDILFEDDDYSYLEDCNSPCLHSDHKYTCESKLDADQPDEDKIEKSLTDYPWVFGNNKEVLDIEVSTEQLYWPFHRFFNVKGQRRLQLSPFLQVDYAGERADGEHTSHIIDLPTFVKPISNRKDKGLLSTSASFAESLNKHHESDQPEQADHKILYMGIIDVLQQFNLRKRIEARMRIYQGDGWQDASCVHPDLYADRFLKFFDEITLKKSSTLPSVLGGLKEEHESSSDVSYEEVSFAMSDGNA